MKRVSRNLIHEILFMLFNSCFAVREWYFMWSNSCNVIHELNFRIKCSKKGHKKRGSKLIDPLDIKFYL